jgi:hypothetical protein
VFTAFEKEKQEPVLQVLCQFLNNWVRLTKSLPAVVISAFESFLNRLLTMKIAGAGTLRSIIITLKVIAQTEVGPAEQISSLTRLVFLNTNLEKIGDGESEGIDLLSAVGRIDSSFLAQLVDECHSLPWRNARAVAAAIKRVEGPGSQLLDRILSGESIAPETKNFVLELRGL